jgi:hypothetical protein
MVSRQLFVRVLEPIILQTAHSLFQLPGLLSRLLENQGQRIQRGAQNDVDKCGNKADLGYLTAPTKGVTKIRCKLLAACRLRISVWGTLVGGTRIFQGG